MLVFTGRLAILPAITSQTEFYNIQQGTIVVSEIRKLVAVRSPHPDRAIAHDVLSWDSNAHAQLNHVNVLKFYGVINVGSRVCTVSAWAEQGDLREYLKQNAGADRRRILLQVATGLEYLHSSSESKPPMVHGNLHVTNVLMQNGVPLISDFAYSVYQPSPQQPSRQPNLLDKIGPMGHTTSLAPEIIATGMRTVESDVYALGMLMFEAYAGRGPFSELPLKHGVAFAAVARLGNGYRPQRTAVTRRDFTEDLWRLTTHCWAHDARARPPVPEIRRRLEG